MNKSLLMSLSVCLALTACQNTPPAGPATPQTPAPQASAIAPLTQASTTPLPSPTASAKPGRTVISAPPIARPTPGNVASATPTETPTSAVSPQPDLPLQPEGGADVQMAANYNTTTLLAGLRSGAGLSAAEDIASRHGLVIERHIASIGTVVFHTQGQSVPELLAKLQNEPALEYVEADQVATQKPENESDVTASFRIFADAAANDTYFSQQYSLPAMRVPESWELSTGEGVVVAVIDTGVDTDHPDLKGRLVDGYDAFSQKSGPGAGDVSSLNYVMSSYKHGTHVAGVIAAETNNGKGIAGVAPSAKVMPIKIFPDLTDMIKSIIAPPDNAGQTIISILADGIVWATDNGADVINMSLAVTEDSATLRRAVEYALEHNVSVIVAAGNDRHLNNARNHLAAIEGVVGVAATDPADKVTFFSNSGDYVDVAAPGLDIISTVPSFLNINSYINMSGTSMAAPNVAGVAALLKSKYGAQATPAWILNRLQDTATDKGDAGRDDLYGYGLVNTYKALGGE
ncbi:MAG: S8 family serine peptidase [Candidatus Sericytochromatia bacterium]